MSQQLDCDRRVVSVSIAAVLLATALAVAAGPWQIAKGEVVMRCPMTIGGSFDAKTTALTGTLTASGTRPSALEGSLEVDLRTIDTGIGLRNEHLREKYLEVDKGAGYDRAVLSQIELKGLSPDAPEGKGSFTGSLTLHGVARTISGPVDVRKAGTALRVKATFPVTLPDYNIADPRYLGVGVKDTVQVEVTFTTTP